MGRQLVAPGQGDDEFLAAIARRHLPCPLDVPAQHLGHAPQAFVAQGVAVGVVDRLEMIDVHQEHRQRPFGADGAADLLLEKPLEMPAIAEPGQGVGLALVQQLAIQSLQTDLGLLQLRGAQRHPQLQFDKGGFALPGQRSGGFQGLPLRLDPRAALLTQARGEPQRQHHEAQGEADHLPVKSRTIRGQPAGDRQQLDRAAQQQQGPGRTEP